MPSFCARLTHRLGRLFEELFLLLLLLALRAHPLLPERASDDGVRKIRYPQNVPASLIYRKQIERHLSE